MSERRLGCLPFATPRPQSRVIDATRGKRNAPRSNREGVERRSLTTFPELGARGCPGSPGSMRQQTIRRPVTLEGVGLHSGKQARVTLSPAPEDTGIVFRAGADRIAAAPQSVVNSHYATTIGRNGTRVQTVEHLMAAAAGLRIANPQVQVDGPEIPAMDGSAKPFVTLLAAAGRNQQAARRRTLTLPYPIRVGSGGRGVHNFPPLTLPIHHTPLLDHPAIRTPVLARNAATARRLVL